MHSHFFSFNSTSTETAQPSKITNAKADMTHIKWVSYSSIDSHPCFFCVYRLSVGMHQRNIHGFHTVCGQKCLAKFLTRSRSSKLKKNVNSHSTSMNFISASRKWQRSFLGCSFYGMSGVSKMKVGKCMQGNTTYHIAFLLTMAI